MQNFWGVLFLTNFYWNLYSFEALYACVFVKCVHIREEAVGKIDSLAL